MNETNKLQYPEKSELPNIYDFIGCRPYLEAFIGSMQRFDSKNSLRKMCDALHTGGDFGYLQQVLNGRKNITDTFIERFSCHLLRLNEEEKEYFLTMIRYEQASIESEKSMLFSKMCGLNSNIPKLITHEVYGLFRNWYTLALRVILDAVDFPKVETCGSISRRMLPPVSEEKVKEAIDLLIEAKMIAPDAAGNYRPTEKRITTGLKAKERLVKDWQYEYFKLGSRHFREPGFDKRDYSTYTFSCSKKKIATIEKMIADFIKQIDLAVCSEEVRPETVYHINVQLFPLMKEA